MKTKWLERSSGPDMPHLTLCLSERQFFAALAALGGVQAPDPWVERQGWAATHTFDHSDGGVACVVCIWPPEGAHGTGIAALLVHEAVHVWQRHIVSIGERNPGAEQEAYAIQIVAQVLMDEYARQISITRKDTV